MAREIIRVKGQPSVDMTTWVTRHGPIFLAEGKQRLALRWTAAEHGMLQYPFLDIDRALNWVEFTTAIAVDQLAIAIATWLTIWSACEL